MKRIVAYLVFAFLALGCQKSYVKHYDLAVDATSYTLPAEGDSFPLFVYCSGPWQVSLTTEVSWLNLTNTSGEGIGSVRVSFEDNDVAEREADLKVMSGDKSILVHFSQKYNSTRLEVQ